MVEPSQKTLHPREVIGLIVAIDEYDSKEFENVTFAKKEVARILPLFQKFCKDEVKVLTNPSSEKLDDYFNDIAFTKALALRKEDDGKAGCTLLFHYVGHGAIVKTYTSMWLNEEIKEACNPYPIESKIRAFVKTKNTFAVGIINCCRQLFEGTLAGNSHEEPSENMCLIFSAQLNTLASATESFGIRCETELQNQITNGQGVLKFPQAFQMGNWEKTGKIMREVHLTVASPIQKPQPVPQAAYKKYVFTYTTYVAEFPSEQDQEHPVKAKLNWFNPLNGVASWQQSRNCYQFISLDGTRSKFDSSECKGHWIDRIIPKGKQIRTVETLLWKLDGYLWGFKWIGDDGAVLVNFGFIDLPDWRNHPNAVLQSLTLNHNQRLLGVHSNSRGKKKAEHFSFQWVICTEE